MKPITTLVSFVERCEARVGLALDFAGAGKGEALVDAIEMAAEHLVAARVPIESAINWPAVITTVQNVGYEGPLILDVPEPRGPVAAILKNARATRDAIVRLFTR